MGGMNNGVSGAVYQNSSLRADGQKIDSDSESDEGGWSRDSCARSWRVCEESVGGRGEAWNCRWQLARVGHEPMKGPAMSSPNPRACALHTVVANTRSTTPAVRT